MGLRRTPWGGNGVRKFSPSCEDGVKQNHAWQRQRPHPSAPPCPIAIPTNNKLTILQLTTNNKLTI